MASSRCLVACSIALVAASGFLAAIFIYGIVLFAGYTPVYRPIECTHMPSLGGVPSFRDGWANITGIARKTCRNPNAYEISVRELSTGSVYAKVNDTLKEIGRSFVHPVTFPAGGEQKMAETEMTIGVLMSDPEAMALLGQDVVQIVSDIAVEMSASMEFLGLEKDIVEKQHSLCGFEVEPSTFTVGFTACEATEALGPNLTEAAAALAIPDVHENGSFTTYAEMTPAQYAQATRLKNATFGAILGASGALCLALLAGGIAAGRRASSKRRGARGRKVTGGEGDCAKLHCGEVGV